MFETYDKRKEDETDKSGGNVPCLSSLVDGSNEDVGCKGGDDGDYGEPSSSAVLVHLGGLFLLLLGLEKTRVSAELEEKVSGIGEEEDYSRAA